VGIKQNFHITIDNEVKKYDLPELSQELQTDFNEIFVPLLRQNPYEPEYFSNHNLEGRLEGCKALEIEREDYGYRECYRLIYKIIDNNKTKIVRIISFGLHDTAYDRANERASRKLY
jgi:mRNA interferase RelE/StbE